MLMQSTAIAGAVTAAAFVLGRVLFGLVLAFMGLNHFQDIEGMAAYAGAKGIPFPEASVVLSGVMLLVGGLGIALGIYPAIAAVLLVAFFVVSTPTMHDFWAVPEEERQAEMTNFLKNISLLGGTLVFLALSQVTWPYAVGLSFL
jgi:putative oxidoreductase